MTKVSFEYVASGLSYTHITSNKFLHNPEAIQLINETFSRINGPHNNKFSLLFNAWTERNFGPKLQAYKESVHQIHSDSGGLQIITVGKKINQQMYDQIYQTQGAYSDVAMSFDEIPVKMEEEMSKIANTSGRRFDRDKVDHFARLSGQNLNEQIEMFLRLESTCKPFLIAHGNCRETYVQWIETMLECIRPSWHKHIGGIAISGAALGRGFLEDIQKAAYLKEMLDYHNVIHILGVGSTRRLLPFITFVQSGYYDKPFHLSYDSTTHTSGLARAAYVKDGKEYTMGRYMNRTYEIVYKEIDRFMDYQKYGIDIGYFYNNTMKKDYSILKEDNGDYNLEEVLRFCAYQIGWLAASIDDLAKLINELTISRRKLLQVATRFKMSREIHSLLSITEPKEFDQWYKYHGHYVGSQRISSTPQTTLDVLF